MTPSSRAQDGQQEAEQHRDAEAVDQTAQHVARLVVGAEQMPPAGRRGRRLAEVLDDGVVAVGDHRPQHPALGVDQLGDLGILVVGLGGELAAEGGLGVGLEDREIEGAVVAHQDRPVVGDQFGEQADEEQRGEEDERPGAAPIGEESLEAAPRDRRKPHQAPRASKSIRGSTSMYIRSPISPTSRPSRPRVHSVPNITG